MSERGQSGEAECIITRRVTRIINHAAYNDASMVNDISLLELEANVDYEPIQEIDSSDGFADSIGAMLTVVGWGATSSGGSVSDVVLRVKVPVVSNSKCDEAYGTGSISSGMMCAGYTAGGKDSCQGDSGGPLFGIDGSGARVLVGVVSWGRGCVRRPWLPSS